MAEACAPQRTSLPSIFPGSWINADFYIWIGHPDDQRAWSQLADARRALDAASGVPADALARAWEEMLIAEGSDWFWWYGDDHSSDHDRTFDELFRRHVRNIYRAHRRTGAEELLRQQHHHAAAAARRPRADGLHHPDHRRRADQLLRVDWRRLGRDAARRRRHARGRRRDPPVRRSSSVSTWRICT